MSLRYLATQEWPLILTATVVMLSGLLGWRYYSSQLASPAVHEVATVVRFGQSASEKGDFPTVIVRRADGRIQQLWGRKRVLAECRVGEPIHLVQAGAILRLDVPACPK